MRVAYSDLVLQQKCSTSKILIWTYRIDAFCHVSSKGLSPTRSSILNMIVLRDLIVLTFLTISSHVFSFICWPTIKPDLA